MRSLGSIRARVERLASACRRRRKRCSSATNSRYERCPACNYDLMAHARAAAWVEAVKGRDRPPPFVHVLPEHLTCPRCGATLPS